MHRLEKMFGKRRYRESVSSTEDETVPSTRNSISAARTGNLAASAAAATTTRRFQKKRNRPPVLAQAVSATNDDKKDDCDEGARCWACQVYLAVPTSEQVCCYVLHSHAVLEDTPICCVCQELVQDARDNEDACVGCGDDAPGRLFLCDATDACDCRFCDTCVQQALGSRSAVDDLAASDEPWECLACQPPPRLRALAAANCAAVTAATTARRTPEQIAEELAIAEEKKCSCLDLLDDEDTQRAAIAEELSDEEEVEEELEAWKTQQINHLARLDDFIASLQDELELEHHVNMSYCYDKLIESGETKYIELALDKKLQADEVNALREAKERDKEVVPVLPGEYYEAECYDDVEDIEDEKHVDTSSLRKNQTGWSTGRKPSTSAIRCAQEVEDERMAQMRVTIEAVKEEHDTNETIQENAESSMQEVSRGNVRMRVRRKSTAHRSRNPATEKAARTSSSESKKASSATVTALSQRKKAPGAAPKRVLGNAEMPLDLCSSSDEQDVEASVAQPKTGQGTSSFCICSSDVRKVYVNRKLVKLLKPHQKEGVQFIWNSSFCDFADHPEGSEEHPKLGGCILAHNMVSLVVLLPRK